MTLSSAQWLCSLALFAIPAVIVWSFVAPMLRKARYLRAQAEYRAGLDSTPTTTQKPPLATYQGNRGGTYV